MDLNTQKQELKEINIVIPALYRLDRFVPLTRCHYVRLYNKVPLYIMPYLGSVSENSAERRVSSFFNYYFRVYCIYYNQILT
jgi:hypothetical protein